MVAVLMGEKDSKHITFGGIKETESRIWGGEWKIKV